MADTDCGHTSCRTWVTITWHTGRTDRHRCHSVDLMHGVLRLHESMVASQDTYTRCIPLANIREYTTRQDQP